MNALSTVIALALSDPHAPHCRQRIEDLIERLVEALDEFDGDENREPYLAGFEVNFMEDREWNLADASSDREEDPAEGYFAE